VTVSHASVKPFSAGKAAKGAETQLRQDPVYESAAFSPDGSIAATKLAIFKARIHGTGTTNGRMCAHRSYSSLKASTQLINVMLIALNA
jgi:hypothetical protein